MNILVIGPIILRSQKDEQSWVTVPSLGYGGIETVIFALVNGLVHHKCNVTIIGCPGSIAFDGVTIVRDIRGAKAIDDWIHENCKQFDIIHDHSQGIAFDSSKKIDFPYIATHHKTGRAPYLKNTVYLSYAQLEQAQAKSAPVIRLPIMFSNYLFAENKRDYYLYLGRVSKWKGVYEAAAFCRKLNARLIIAGPCWEKEYLDSILQEFSDTVLCFGEVAGLKKIDLLSNAKALFILSRPVDGPWGDEWCEPGATVVGEAAASGTPVIASSNGCLKEIVTKEIGVQLNEFEIETLDISKLYQTFPDSIKLFNYADRNWNQITIAKEYLELYDKVINGLHW